MKLRVFVLLCVVIVSLTANPIQLGDGDGANAIRLLDNHENGLRLQTSLASLQAVPIASEHGAFTLLIADGFAWSTVPGQPRLPVIRKVIAVPLGATVTANVLSSSRQTLDLAALGYDTIYPAQPSLSKSADPAEAPFAIDAATYATEAWVGDMGVSVEEMGILRGMRLFLLTVRLASYNPVSNQLRLWSDTEIEVSFSGGDLAATANLRARTWSPAFESSLAGSVFNYTTLNTRDPLTSYPQSMIIVADRMFETQLQPFIEWKQASGFYVHEAYTDEIGSNPGAIQAYIQDIWDAATPNNPAPSFVIFVGDTPQINAFSGSTGNHVTDLNYVRLEGNDYMPEMFYGRFSANDTAQLQPQIDKTLTYEMHTMPDPGYLGEVVMIAGMDASHGHTWGNGQINYGTSLYFNDAHGINSHTYLYPNSGGNSANIIDNISNGVGYVNYTAHGSSTSWADPGFTIPNINGLQNADEYPLVVGNCCLTNKFEVAECFGEAWLRAENKGAIGYIGGTNSTYWDEDYWWGVGNGPVVANPTYHETGLGVYDGLFHDHAEPFADWYTTAGAMIVRGNLAVVEGGGSANYYWEIYSLMGDPSLMPYMGQPIANDADWPEQILFGLTEITITAEPYSYVALSFDGEMKGVGLVDGSGSLTLTFEPFTTPGDAQLVITAQNRIPLIVPVPVIPNVGPYMVLDDFLVSGENNGVAEYGEAFTLDIDICNVGADDAFNVTATLSINDAYTTITSAAADIGALAAGAALTLEAAFALELADNVPDQHEVSLTVTFNGEDAAGETLSWVSEATLVAAAPAFDVAMFVVDDSAGNDNGIADPGETVVISVPVTNTGHAVSPNAVATMVCNHQWLSFDENSVVLGEMGIGAEETADYTVTVAADAIPGTLIPVGFGVTAGSYANQQVFNLPVSVVAEDFENGLALYGWQMGGGADWFLQQSTVWEGDYSLESGDIGNNQTTWTEVTLDVVAAGEISFYYKVSSEAGYDYLRFYIDNQQMGQWAGNVDWTIAEYDVSVGEHTFKWAYEKDYSMSGGSDCGWIDYVQLPFSGGEPSPIAFLPVTEIDFGDVAVGETSERTFTVFNYGSLDLSGTIETCDGFTLDLPATTRKHGEGSRSVAGRVDYEFAIEPMSHQVFTAVFAPTEAIDYSGQFLIATNDPFAPDFSIEVTANALNDTGDEGVSPFVTALGGNFPNPFNPETTVAFSLAEPQNVTIDIFNVLGQRVARLVDTRLEAGPHTVVWHGIDSHGDSVGSGIYFCRMEASGGRYTSVKKMILLK
ncbi:MAG: T9SS type A sorting domain-containing protein [Candidatus Cloacimonetes bacterium]|nr:T9SS type A sorting domain-containing protein [Candidatus Cloacimonadota bacterium]